MVGLSKSRIIVHRQCPKRLWLQINRPDLLEESVATGSRMATGNSVGNVAHSMYPDGVLIDTESLGQALEATQDALKATSCPIFEATFQYQGVLVRADLLFLDNGQYRMAEVKSSTSVKDYHLADAAVQAWVARGSGLNLSVVEIAHIDRSFIYPGGNDYRGLLRHADITAQIYPLEQDVPNWIAAAQATLAGDEPSVPPGDQCSSPFECPFIKYCSPQVDELDNAQDQYPVEILPYGGALAASLRSEGFVDLRDVPEGRLSKPMHLRVWRATKHDTPELAPLAGEHVRALGYPRYYIDFETMQFAIPIWAGTRPYDQIPFQWSCHIETSKGFMTHTAFLADGSGDPRRPFADSLISTVGNKGAVIVYNAAFERTRLLELAESFPDLAPALNNIIERIFDLLPVARQNYYHPDMRGSWSIKAVLPTIAPELAYDELEVGNGGMAQEAFAEILLADTPLERSDQLRKALLTYCERDTLAMVKIAHYFENAIDVNESRSEKPKGFLMNATQTPHPFNGWMFLATDSNLRLMPQDIAVPWVFKRETRGKHKAEHIDYFISYRRDGGATNARLLYEVLRLRGLHGFIDTEKLVQGNYSEAITQNIRIAKNFILVVSPGAFDSEWVIKEIKEALDSGCKIIPVFTDGTKCFPANLPVYIAKLSDNNAITLDHSNFEEKFKQLIDWLETPHVKLVNACFRVWENSENGVDDMIDAWTSISGTQDVFAAIKPILRKLWQGSSDGNTTSEVLSSIGTRDLKDVAIEIGVEHKGNRATLLANINDRLRGEKIHLIDEDRKEKNERYYRVMTYMAEFAKSGDKLQRLKEMVGELELDPDNRLSSRPLMEAIFDSPKFESVDEIFEILDLDANEIKSICAEFVVLEGRAVAGFRTQFRAWVDYEDRIPL